MRLKSLHINKIPFEVVDLAGEVLLLRAENSLIAQIGRSLRELNLDFVSDIIVTETEICLRLNRPLEHEDIDCFGMVPLSRAAGRLLRLPIHFDLAAAESQIRLNSGLSADAYCNRLLAGQFEVAMLGFLPGFAYLGGLDDGLQLPRMKTPDTRIAPQTLAAGGPYLGLYSLPSPAGWWPLGRFPTPILGLQGQRPSLIGPGDRLVLEAIDAQEFQALLTTDILTYNGIT